MNNQDATNLAEIDRLLDEAYSHYFDGSDGHCKMSEGHVTVSFGNYFDRRGTVGDKRMAVTEVSIYSYIFGPGRNHEFETTADALDAVREWHKEEVATVYCSGCLLPKRDDDDCLCTVDLSELPGGDGL